MPPQRIRFLPSALEARHSGSGPLNGLSALRPKSDIEISIAASSKPTSQATTLRVVVAPKAVLHLGDDPRPRPAHHGAPRHPKTYVAPVPD